MSHSAVFRARRPSRSALPPQALGHAHIRHQSRNRSEFSLSAPGGGEGRGEVGEPRFRASAPPTSPSPLLRQRVPSLSPRKRAERANFATAQEPTEMCEYRSPQAGEGRDGVGLLWLVRDQRGVAAVIVAITLPLLFAFGALAINSGMSYWIKRQNQSAADAAAISAAYRVLAYPPNNVPSSVVDHRLTPAAIEAATQNGWANTGNPPTVTYPYSDAYVTDGVAVTLQQNSLFAFAPLANVTIATRAVAVGGANGGSGPAATLPRGCLLALGLTLSGDADLPRCGDFVGIPRSPPPIARSSRIRRPRAQFACKAALPSTRRL